MTDPFSEVLRSVRLTGGVFLDAQFTAPWCVLSKITAEDCRFALGAVTQVIAYHFIIDGRLILTVEGEPPIEVRAGASWQATISITPDRFTAESAQA